MVLDPVCGRELSPKQSQWLLSYKGDTYHFCSGVCEHRFNANPAEYVEEETKTSPRPILQEPTKTELQLTEAPRESERVYSRSRAQLAAA